MTNLFSAHQQWATRPASERYSSLRELHEVLAARRAASRDVEISPWGLRFETTPDNRVCISGDSNKIAFTHWSMNQFCELSGAPAKWIRSIPPQLAAANLNQAALMTPREKMKMLWAPGNGDLGTLRAINTMTYSRYWDDTVVSGLREIVGDGETGWVRPPAITDDKYPSGIYAGDRNIFIFLVNESLRIDDGSAKGLARGFFLWNSEVGQMSYGMRGFLYQYVCGNHIVWGAKNIFDLRLFHSGDIAARIRQKAAGLLEQYAESSLSGDQAIVNAARRKTIASDTTSAAEWLARRSFSLKNATAIVGEAERAGDDPTILWNLVTAGTRLNRAIKFPDERTAADESVSRLLSNVG